MEKKYIFGCWDTCIICLNDCKQLHLHSAHWNHGFSHGIVQYAGKPRKCDDPLASWNQETKIFKTTRALSLLIDDMGHPLLSIGAHDRTFDFLEQPHMDIHCLLNLNVIWKGFHTVRTQWITAKGENQAAVSDWQNTPNPSNPSPHQTLLLRG